MDPSNNFHSYRSTLKAAMWRSIGATDERQRIIIPFFSLLVKDLYFISESSSNHILLLPDHINFEKFSQISKHIYEFVQWKKIKCPFCCSSQIIEILETIDIGTENFLSRKSFECEPPDSAMERERLKALKNEAN